MADKYEKAVVNYTTGKGDRVCGNCAHYQNGACTLVDGKISKGGVCRLFSEAPHLRPPGEE